MTVSAGWRPVPFREFVFKVHQRCNLRCDYCYVYEMGDQSWRTRPAVMEPSVWRAAGHRIREHVLTHGLTEIRVILHGGEPLLAGRDRLMELVDGLRAILAPHCRPSFVVQTNGTLLTEAMLTGLMDAGVTVGVSLDGSVEQNDRRRHRPDGGGSAHDAGRALALLGEPRFRDAYAGILCTVDPASDPVDTYAALLAYEPPAIDFLLPHANWGRPPQRPVGSGPTPYGDWLVAVFDRWYGVNRQEADVYLLGDIVRLVLGGQSRSEQVGLSPIAVAVIESDGAIEQVDSLRSAYPGACATGLDVFRDSFDAALAHPGIRARQLGADGLCPTCRACRLHTLCGGGHYAHRYHPDSGFANPSVYCADMIRLIEHVQQRVTADLRRRVENARTA